MLDEGEEELNYVDDVQDVDYEDGLRLTDDNLNLSPEEIEHEQEVSASQVPDSTKDLEEEEIMANPRYSIKPWIIE